MSLPRDPGCASEVATSRRDVCATSASDFQVTEQERALLRDRVARERLIRCEPSDVRRLVGLGPTPEDRLLVAVLIYAARRRRSASLGSHSSLAGDSLGSFESAA